MGIQLLQHKFVQHGGREQRLFVAKGLPDKDQSYHGLAAGVQPQGVQSVQRLLAGLVQRQVQQCTVYIDLNEVQTYTPADEGFFSRIGTAFTSGWGNFVNGLQQLVVALACVWPLAVLACAAVAVALAWRRKRSKKQK